MAKSSSGHVVVTVSDQHVASIHSVADALKAAGLQVTNVMPTTGIITGDASSVDAAALAKIPGVASVEPDQEMHAL